MFKAGVNVGWHQLFYTINVLRWLLVVHLFYGAFTSRRAGEQTVKKNAFNLITHLFLYIPIINDNMHTTTTAS